MVTDDYLKSLLKNWALLNVDVMKLSEQTLIKMLKMEQDGRARLRVMLRIYNRLSKVRSIREKQELAAEAKG
jgi:hypothetical protein